PRLAISPAAASPTAPWNAAQMLAFVHDDVVADEAHICAAFHGAVGDAAAGDIADLGYLEDLQDLRIAQHGLTQGRWQQTGHGLLNVVDQVVDDVVVADFDARALGRLARFLVGAHVERDNRDAGGL